MPRRWSYQRETFVPPPAPVVTLPTQLGFLPRWQDPIRQLVAATAISIAFCPQPRPTLPVTPKTLPPQAQQASPILLAARAAWNDFAWAPQPPPNLPVTPTQVGWDQKWQEPVRIPVRAQDSPLAFAAQPPFTVPRGWAAAQFAPVLIPSRAPDPQFAWIPRPLPLPITPSQMGWPAQQCAPPLLAPRPVDPVTAWCPQYIAPFVFSAPIGWNQQQFNPTLALQRALDPQLAYDFRTPPTLPVTPSQLGFWTPFHDIVRVPVRGDAVNSWTPQIFAAPSVPYGWVAAQFAPTLLPARATDSPYIWTPQPIVVVPIRFGWWTPQYASDPVRLPARAIPADLIWIPEPLQLPVTPTQFGWWRPWNDPVRLPGRGDVATPWTPQIVVVAPFTNDWLVSPYSSVIPSLVCSSASVVPALVCYGGAVVENETYMSQLLPFQIQQPFILFPQNGIPVVWSLIVGSTWNTTQTPVTDATGTLTIEDRNGNTVYSAAFAPTSTPGTYQAMINGASFNPNDGINYTSVISFTSPSIAQPGLWTIPTIIRFRTTP